jgi:DNA-binding response OmpR family regulator
VILDINMPEMNGKDFLKKIRKLNNQTPVLALTSNSMLEDKVEVFDLGADDYLTKPFELQELLIRVKAIAKRKQEVVSDTLVY